MAKLSDFTASLFEVIAAGTLACCVQPMPLPATHALGADDHVWSGNDVPKPIYHNCLVTFSLGDRVKSCI